MQAEKTMHPLIILENSDRDENGLLPLQHYELNVMQRYANEPAACPDVAPEEESAVNRSVGVKREPRPHTLASIRS